MADPKVVDPFPRERYQIALGETRGSIQELEGLVTPLRRVVENADQRLVLLRLQEARYMEALRG